MVMFLKSVILVAWQVQLHKRDILQGRPHIPRVLTGNLILYIGPGEHGLSLPSSSLFLCVSRADHMPLGHVLKLCSFFGYITNFNQVRVKSSSGGLLSTFA